MGLLDLSRDKPGNGPESEVHPVSLHARRKLNLLVWYETGMDVPAGGRIDSSLAGGLGIRLMLDCLDEVRFDDGGTRLTLVKLRGPGAGGGDPAEDGEEEG